MATLENITRNYIFIKDEDSAHHRHFMNSVTSKRDCWNSRRRYGHWSSL